MKLLRQKEFSSETARTLSKRIPQLPINIINRILKNWKTTIVEPILCMNKEYPMEDYVDWNINNKEDYINSITLDYLYYDFIEDEIYIQLSVKEKIHHVSGKIKTIDNGWELIYSGKTGKFNGYGDY